MGKRKAIGALNLYELIFRDYKPLKPVIDIVPTENIIDHVLKIGINLGKSLSFKPEILNFSDVIYDLTPLASQKNNKITYKYVPKLKNVNKKSNAKQYMMKFKNFNINDLPFIDLARFLNIKVEKNNLLNNCYARYNPTKNKITLGTNYKPDFIHELAHAIDYFLPGKIDDYSFKELVAEFSTVVICKEYNIKINTSLSLRYLDYFSRKELVTRKLLERVAKIFLFVKEYGEL